MAKKMISLNVEETVWEDFKAHAKTMSLSASLLAEMMFKATVRGKKETIKQVYQGLLVDMIHGAKDMSEEDKERAEKLVMDTEP